MKILDVKNLSFNYVDFPPVWENLNFSINEGDITVLLGPSGSGKSVLLQQLIYKLAPFGNFSGEILYRDEDLLEMDPKTRVAKIAYVAQNPDDQLISESVWQEMSFNLENLGVEPEIMRSRIAEIANFFGIQEWFWDKTHELSGGQKQILNVASALVLKPDILVLDEADSSLDPVTRSEFLAMLKRLNEELGLTILMSSHNWSMLLPFADKVLYLDEQSIQEFDSGSSFAMHVLRNKAEQAQALPAATQLSLALGAGEAGRADGTGRAEVDLAMTVGQAKKQLADADRRLEAVTPPVLTKKENILEVKDLSFRYKKTGQNILNHMDFSVPEKSISFILGGNGSGKSSLLKCLVGQVNYAGKIKWSSNAVKLAYLPQNVRLLFSAGSILDEINNAYNLLGPEALDYLADLLTVEKTELSAARILTEFGLGHRLDFHPSDLSGGELQRAALALVLLDKTDVLLLDEPSNNLAYEDKKYLGELLLKLKGKGLSIIAVSHDLEFCAELADYQALLFQGEILSFNRPHEFFNDNFFYTTDASRISRDFTASGYSAITGAELLASLEGFE